jgi:hypothetical protein
VHSECYCCDKNAISVSERKADIARPTSANVQNACSYTRTSPYVCILVYEMTNRECLKNFKENRVNWATVLKDNLDETAFSEVDVHDTGHKRQFNNKMQ